MTGFGRVGRDANLNLGCWIGDDCVWRCENILSSGLEFGDDARRGDDDKGEETDGRWWSQLLPVKMGCGANDSIVSVGEDLFCASDWLLPCI